MERRRLLDAAQERELQQKLELMFSLRALGQDYHDEYGFIRKSTEELLYTIPSALMLVDEEMCSTIFLSLYQRIDRIILSYRISASTSYIDYLKGILKLRVRSIMRRRDELDRVEEIHNRIEVGTTCESCWSDEPSYLVERFEESPHERRMFYGDQEPSSQRGRYTSLRECFSVIVDHVPASRRFKDRKLSGIYSYLRSHDNRRDMLIMILTAKEDLDVESVEHLAMIFDVDAEVMGALESFRHERRKDIHERRMQQIEIRNHHWMRYVALANAFEMESDEEKKAELGMLRDKCIDRLHAKCDAIRGLGKRLSVRAIADEIGLSPSMVSLCARQARAALEMIVSCEENAC